MSEREQVAYYYILKKDDLRGVTARGPFTALDAEAAKGEDERVVSAIRLREMQAPIPAPPEAAKKRLGWLKIVGVGLAACVLAAVACVGSQFLGAIAQKDNIQATLTQFMELMMARDSAAASELFVSRFLEDNGRASLAQMLRGNNYLLFDGFERLEVTNITMGIAASSAGGARGRVIKTEGTVYYAGGATGQFQATFEFEDDVWKIFGVHLTIPPDKQETSGDA